MSVRLHAGSMSKVVHLRGEVDAVYTAIADRLERAGATLTAKREDAELTISLGNSSHTASPPADIAVIHNSLENPIADIIVRVHDILVPEGVVGWGSDVLNDWVSWVREGSEGIAPPDIEARHWVHIRDAADAITLIALVDADAMTQGVIDLAGRRAWSADAVLGEMNLLWRRYTNALNLTHTIESLANVPSPAAKQIDKPVERPNLGPLHEAMLAAGREEGWRPLTAMRVGLMELFAHTQGE